LELGIAADRQEVNAAAIFRLELTGTQWPLNGPSYMKFMCILFLLALTWYQPQTFLRWSGLPEPTYTFTSTRDMEIFASETSVHIPAARRAKSRMNMSKELLLGLKTVKSEIHLINLR
jgi:hypothetical protein